MAALESGNSGDGLRRLLVAEEFRAAADPDDRYLAVLAWCAVHHASDFGEFVSRQDSARRYLGLGRDEFEAARARRRSRQIDGTRFWAVLNIDREAKRSFVCRLLEFVGCPDDVVDGTTVALGLGRRPARANLLWAA